jgi:hypothetical protein
MFRLLVYVQGLRANNVNPPVTYMNCDRGPAHPVYLPLPALARTLFLAVLSFDVSRGGPELRFSYY